jgi:predicted nucleotidyltransferase
MMKPELLLARYREERDALQSRIEAVLRADRRVCAAWLWGSQGRGETDALSDIDLWVVVEDAYLETVVAERQAYVSQVATPLLIHEAPQNAPIRGAYLCAVYGGETGTQHTDWYWQARSVARMPPDVKLLVSRAEIPRSDDAPRFAGTEHPPVRSPNDALEHHIRSFWSLLPIAAKYVARRSLASQSHLILMVLDSLTEVHRFVGSELIEASAGARGFPDDPYAQLDSLGELTVEMATLMDCARQRGIDVPDDAIVEAVTRYLQVTRAKLEVTAS